jgi:ribonuclease Z
MRRWLRRAVWLALALVILVAAARALLSLAVVHDALVARGAARQVAVIRDDLLDTDGLRVALCGTGSPMPSPDRAQACVMVIAARRIWFVDAGARSANNLSEWRVPTEHVAGVLLTHFHSDHIGDLGELNLQSWVLGRKTPLEVYGPPGVEQVVDGFNAAYALDASYRVAHHGAAMLDPEVGRLGARTIELPPAGGGPGAMLTVVDAGGLRIRAFAVDHAPVAPALGYRFDFAGRSVVVSGDTRKCPAMVAAAKGSDLLLHEAQANHIVAVARRVAEEHGQARRAKILADIPSYHTSPLEAAEIARAAGVKMLGLYHLTPPPPNGVVAAIFTRGVADVLGDRWVLTRDGTMFTLPAGSDDIEVSTMD